MKDQALAGIRTGVSTATDAADAVREFHAAVAQQDPAVTVFFCSPSYDRAALEMALRERFGSTPLIGCTTAGEITPRGYLDHSLTGFSLPSNAYAVATHLLSNLQSFEISQGLTAVNDLHQQLSAQELPADEGINRFALLLIDGLSMREEPVASSLHTCLGNVPLFGGSAGDGLDFGSTHVYHGGAFHEDSAVIMLVETSQATMVFKTQHFESTHQKMVVTAADTRSRTVYEINGEPAAQEYARMVGVGGIAALDPTVFATHPVVVRIGGGDYVRSIQKVGERNSLIFYCAIDEGLVLTLARGTNMVQDLDNLFADVNAKVGPPQLIIGCDCILRNLEIRREQHLERISEMMTRHNVVGFSTYGEQFNSMHVNQTFTGVAIGRKAA
jgi:hypothetical protein